MPKLSGARWQTSPRCPNSVWDERPVGQVLPNMRARTAEAIEGISVGVAGCVSERVLGSQARSLDPKRTPLAAVGPRKRGDARTAPVLSDACRCGASPASFRE